MLKGAPEQLGVNPICQLQRRQKRAEVGTLWHQAAVVLENAMILKPVVHFNVCWSCLFVLIQ